MLRILYFSELMQNSGIKYSDKKGIDSVYTCILMQRNMTHVLECVKSYCSHIGMILFLLEIFQ